MQQPLSEHLRQLIDRWLDEDLPEDESETLHGLLAETSGAIEWMADRALLHQWLGKTITDLRSTESQTAKIDPSRRWHMRSLLAAAAVTAVSLAILIIAWPRSASASANFLVQKALATCQPIADRHYRVHVESRNALRLQMLRSRNDRNSSNLWVRGNQFVQRFEHSEERLAWGRDASGDVWFTVDGASAAVFRSREIPESLEEVCDLRTLDLPTLLQTLLRDYDLTYRRQDVEVETIQATVRPAIKRSKYGRIEIEIERESSMVRRVSMERVRDGRVVAIVHFDWIETKLAANTLYDIPSYLQPDAPILDHRSPRGDRADLLREFLGRLRVSQWPR
ncbi:MAG: hypothetical protein ACKN81_02505 [Pirellulaceae bacterium]